jgi:hypothetical protein
MFAYYGGVVTNHRPRGHQTQTMPKRVVHASAWSRLAVLLSIDEPSAPHVDHSVAVGVTVFMNKFLRHCGLHHHQPSSLSVKMN